MNTPFAEEIAQEERKTAREEVKLKILFFSEYSVQTNRNFTNSEYCCGDRKTKTELKIEVFCLNSKC